MYNFYILHDYSTTVCHTDTAQVLENVRQKSSVL